MSIASDFFNPTILSSFAFLVATLILVHITIKNLSLKNKKISIKISFFIALFLLAWFVIVFFIGRKGFFAKNPFVAPFIFIGFIFLFGILQKLYTNEKIKKIFQAMPQHWLIGIQLYRIVGIGFIFLYMQGELPATFAFSAGIGDMIVGFSAPLVAYFYYKQKPHAQKLAVLWNIIGILDLVLAIGIGIIGFPRPIQLVPVSPSTEQLSLFPLMIVPLFAVPLALFLHFCGLKALRKK